MYALLYDQVYQEDERYRTSLKMTWDHKRTQALYVKKRAKHLLNSSYSAFNHRFSIITERLLNIHEIRGSITSKFALNHPLMRSLASLIAFLHFFHSGKLPFSPIHQSVASSSTWVKVVIATLVPLQVPTYVQTISDLVHDCRLSKGWLDESSFGGLGYFTCTLWNSS